MRNLCVEWKHLDLNDGTCLRCSETGKTLQQVIKELRNELEEKDVHISFIETKLSEDQIPQSNLVLINGKPIESIISGAEVGKNYCLSCSCLTGDKTFCRTVSYNDEIFEEIPEKLIRLAIMNVIEGTGEVVNK